MSDGNVATLGANQPAPDLNGPQMAGSIDFMQKYNDERDKRIKPSGLDQYIELQDSGDFKQLAEDRWTSKHESINKPTDDGGHCKVLIAGAGFGGILFAVRLIQAGFSAKDLIIVDPAGGFGGTWWWNRYPGVMCDIESYIYLPLLEEMGYMPKTRYAFGHEIRKYADSIAEKYGLAERAMFQTSCKQIVWDDSSASWATHLALRPKEGVETHMTVHADFVLIASGVLNNPKLPDLEGLKDFKGYMFHTARWDYSYTGGTPENPDLSELRGKQVAFIGTGASAVQATPIAAEYAEKLYVFQRTPSSIDIRNNHKTDSAWWKSNVATKQGWQKERALNFLEFTENNYPKPSSNLVNDYWTSIPSYSALIGTAKPVTMENVVDHIGELHALDYPRQERVRQRALEIVHDQGTAKALQAWYPSWCKRPCFHDDYLQAFNSSNVELVDTDGRGVERITSTGIEVNGKHYDVDVIIWASGFRTPLLGGPAGKANMQVLGRNGTDLQGVVDDGDLRTLHGVTSRGFPNLFWGPGNGQGGISANFTFAMDCVATHVAYIIKEAFERADRKKNPVIEPSAKAQEDWTNQIMAGAATFGGMSGCTPSYLNKEGEIDRMSDEQKMKAAASSLWPNGFASYLDVLEKWRAAGNLDGLELTLAAAA